MQVKPQIGPIGAHVSKEHPLEDAAALQTSVVQLFTGEPQSYKAPQIAYPGGAEALRSDAESAGVRIFVHAPYRINVASLNNRVRIPSRKLLQQHVDAAAEIGASGIIVHGGHVGGEGELATGFDNWRKAIEATDLKVTLLIENTAGGDYAMTRELANIAALWEAISAAEGSENVGFCLDTCHAHAAGLDLSTVVAELREITGRIDLIHLNDSRDEANSGADRHANLGDGFIDPALLLGVLTEAGAPAVLETPGGIDEHQTDLAWVRERLG